MVVSLIMISLFLDGYLSFFVPMYYNSLFMPLCTITSLVVCFPLTKKKYLIAFMIGSLYDLLYTNMLVLHGIIFIIIYYLLNKINIFTKKKILDNIIKLILVITLYRFILIVFSNILYFKKFNIYTLLNNIYSYYIFNIIYAFIMMIILKNMSQKDKYNK
ncbi:MAG: hypothetical protein GX861_03075 [Tenericutes bacterium]|nr:hypothetical protein [Mycoplasmatota bacterium]